MAWAAGAVARGWLWPPAAAAVVGRSWTSTSSTTTTTSPTASIQILTSPASHFRRAYHLNPIRLVTSLLCQDLQTAGLTERLRTNVTWFGWLKFYLSLEKAERFDVEPSSSCILGQSCIVKDFKWLNHGYIALSNGGLLSHGSLGEGLKDVMENVDAALIICTAAAWLLILRFRDSDDMDQRYPHSAIPKFSRSSGTCHTLLPGRYSSHSGPSGSLGSSMATYTGSLGSSMATYTGNCALSLLELHCCHSLLDQGGDSKLFLLAMIYALLGIPLSYLMWYRPLYRAMSFLW